MTQSEIDDANEGSHRKIYVIKRIRERTGLGLREAKELFEKIIQYPV